MKLEGFTLIEMMVALAISLFLLLMLSDVCLSLRAAIHEREEVADGEAQALQVMYYLNQRLPYAGFIGCFNVDRSRPVINHLATEEARVAASTVLTKDPQVLSLQLLEHSLLLSEPMKNGSELMVSHPGELQKNDRVVVGDCSRAEVDQIESIRKVINKSVYKITLTRPLSKYYQPYASIGVLHRYRYWVKSLSDEQHSSALFLEDDKGRSHELVGNVYNLAFQYLPSPQHPRAIVVNFMIKHSKQLMGSRWQFVIPLLEQI